MKTFRAQNSWKEVFYYKVCLSYYVNRYYFSSTKCFLSLVKLVERLLIHNLHSQCHVDKTMFYPTAGIADRELLCQFWEVWNCERVMGTSASPVSAEFQVLLCAHSLVTLYDSLRHLCICLLFAFIRFLSLCSVPPIYIHLYVHYARLFSWAFAADN